ncbi:uncharacterized protein N7506_004586 [Penicillium brevicompactum]|uniref:uncharacterized protein n=1 Tax=Penicillium brevicompactum TaxID=5074 RepID=UPI002541BD4D|nr:uncharacterized protein N7506_004586 [Penicillium brevicompactum]KAJ5336564.1 hypothetical protein N7506_004586 [Penicillium brevicompactum]
MSDPIRRHVSAMNSALEPHRGVGRHPQAANTDDGQLARRACTAAIMQLTGGRGSTLLTTNHIAGAMTHPQFAIILQEIWKLRYCKHAIERIPRTLDTITEEDMEDLEIRRSYEGHLEDLARAYVELPGLEYAITNRIVMLSSRARREFMRLHGEDVNEALGFY